jgi:hypothetical protein
MFASGDARRQWHQAFNSVRAKLEFPEVMLAIRIFSTNSPGEKHRDARKKIA